MTRLLNSLRLQIDSSQSQSVILICSISGQLLLSFSQKHVESSNSGIRRCLCRNGLPVKCFGRLKSSAHIVWWLRISLFLGSSSFVARRITSVTCKDTTYSILNFLKAIYCIILTFLGRSTNLNRIEFKSFVITKYLLSSENTMISQGLLEKDQTSL